MAVIGVAALGAAIAPAGYAAIGWTVGSIVGQKLFGDDVTQEGPRLDNLQAQSATDGVPIAETWGTIRKGGDVIWAPEIQEHVIKDDVGGFLGIGEQEVKEYFYTASFAILLSDRPANVRRIWANHTLVWTAANDASAEELGGNAELLQTFAESTQRSETQMWGSTAITDVSSITVYDGHQTQPDVTIESHEGVGNVPAYTGSVYVVFEDLLLTEYRNVHPTISAELSTGQVTELKRIATWDRPGDAALARISVTYDDGTIKFQALSDNRDGTYDHTVTRYDLSGSELSSITDTVGVPSGDTVNFFASKNDARLAAGRLTGAGAINVAHWYFNGTQFRNIYPPVGEHDFNAVGNQPVVLAGYAYLPGADSNNKDWWVARYPTVDGVPSSVADRYEVIHTIGAITGDVHVSTDGLYLYVYSSLLDELREYDVGLNLRQTWAWTVSKGDGDHFAVVNRRLLYPHSNSATGLARLEDDGTTTHVTFIASSGSGPVFLTPTLISDGDGLVNGMPMIADSGEPLADVVRGIIEDAGVDSADMDVSQLSGTVDGYVRDRPMSAAQLLRPLMRAYRFDLIDADQLIAVPRGQSAVTALSEDDLGAHDGGEPPPPVVTSRVQDLELPQEVTVTYLDRATDYQPGLQRSRRLAVGEAKGRHDVKTALVLGNDQARELAEVLHYDAWLARHSQRIRLAPRHLTLLPGDVLTLELAGGTRTVRLTGVTVGANWLIEAELVPEDGSIYTTGATGAEAVLPPTRQLLPGPTRLALIDIAPMSTRHDTVGYYAALGGYLNAWRGATLYESSDGGQSWRRLHTWTRQEETIMGELIAPLADGPTHGWDRVNTVRVRLFHGAVSSAASLTDVYNYTHIAALGAPGRWELVQWLDATQESDGTWTLSGLLRGRRGSEAHTASHAAGDLFVLLDPTTVQRIQQDSGDIGRTRRYRAPSARRVLGSGEAQDWTLTRGGQTCLAPVRVRAAVRPSDGKLEIRWVRRPRFIHGWGTAPLYESEEKYQVYLLASDGATLTSREATASPYVLNGGIMIPVHEQILAGGLIAPWLGVVLEEKGQFVSYDPDTGNIWLMTNTGTQETVYTVDATTPALIPAYSSFSLRVWAMTARGGYLWLADDDALIRINTNGNDLRYFDGETHYDVISDGTYIYTSTDRGIRRLELATMNGSTLTATPGPSRLAIGTDFGRLWACEIVGSSLTLYEFNSDGTTNQTGSVPERGAYITAVDGYIWLAANNGVWRYDEGGAGTGPETISEPRLERSRLYALGGYLVNVRGSTVRWWKQGSPPTLESEGVMIEPNPAPFYDSRYESTEYDYSLVDITYTGSQWLVLARSRGVGRNVDLGRFGTQRGTTLAGSLAEVTIESFDAVAQVEVRQWNEHTGYGDAGGTML